MISYRFRRRAFMAAMGGGVGLKILLRNLEASAQSSRSPARLLVTHWPVGIVAGSNDALWKPTLGSVGGSLALKPFADAGLGPDMTVFRGMSTPIGTGGGHEGGTVALVTGVAPMGTRSGEQEADDAYAAGPSFDQILLKNVPELQRPGNKTYANAICDSRTDFGEISTKVLSYADTFQAVGAISGPGQEAIPLVASHSPLQQFNNLFSTFAPGTGGAGGGGGGAGGGAPPPVADAMLKKLVGKRSVLDFAVDELNRVKQLAPSEARSKLGLHTDAVLAAEASVAGAINTRYPTPGGGAAGTAGTAGAAGGNGDPSCGGGCTTKPEAPTAEMGLVDRPNGLGNPFGATGNLGPDDSPLLAKVGAMHFSVLKAAFVCDLIRVGTFQWCPGTNHTGFALYPNTTQPYLHHPTSHKISTQDTFTSTKLTDLNVNAQFLFNVQTWYFSRYAESFADWKNTLDGCGNPLLDFTCAPLLTEVAACGHERSNMPGMLIGGSKLGFVHNRYVTDKFSINQLWGTIAQGFGYASTAAPFGAPLAGFWAKP